LQITVGTVKGYAGAILGKLDAASRTEAVGVAIQRGFIDEPMRSDPVVMRASPPAARKSAACGVAAPNGSA